MEWFKHKTNAHNDPVVSDAWDEFGDAGYVIWFVLLELYGQHYKSSKPDEKLNVSKAFLRRKLRKSWTKVEKVLRFYETFAKLSLEISSKRVTIGIPKFTEILSNYTGRMTRQPMQAPTEATARKKKKKSKIQSKSKNKRVEKNTLPGDFFKKTIDEKICFLTDFEIFPEAESFYLNQEKRKKNTGAIEHSFNQLFKFYEKYKDNGYDKKGAWGYCLKVVGEESPNYNERETVAEADRQKQELEQLVRAGEI